MRSRQVFRNRFYVVLGLGIDLLILALSLAVHIAPTGWLVVAVLLVPGLRAALIRVVSGERGAVVVNFWRTHRVSPGQMQAFVAHERNVERRMRVGWRGSYLALVAARTRDGREIPVSAVSATATLTRTEHVSSRWLPGVLERLNASLQR